MASYILQCLFYLILAENDIRCNPPFSPYGARISKSIFIAYGWFPRTRSHMVLQHQLSIGTVANIFGVARSTVIVQVVCTVSHTVCKIVHTTCTAIVERSLSMYIKFPDGDILDSVVDTFTTKWGVPQCVGAINGCHIPIAALLITIETIITVKDGTL